MREGKTLSSRRDMGVGIKHFKLTVMDLFSIYFVTRCCAPRLCSHNSIFNLHLYTLYPRNICYDDDFECDNNDDAYGYESDIEPEPSPW